MSCCDSYPATPELTVGKCPDCEGDVDKDGITTEEGCNYSPRCPSCEGSPCDYSC